MNETLKKTIASGNAIDRAAVLTILQVALAAGEMRFVRQLTEDWLDAYPYDLPVELLRAQALLQENKAEKALQILMRLCDLDPEFIEAQETLAKVARRAKPAIAESARAAAAVLRRPSKASKDIQAWAQALIRAQLAFGEGSLQNAESEVQAALLKEPPSPLPALLHLQIARKQGLSWMAIDNLLKLYLEKFPRCLQLRLQEAAQLMESGSEEDAVDLLHDCVAEDVSGQVARRLWGAGHRFAAIWPSQLSYILNLPIPAKVAAGLGWNHLQSGAQVAAYEEQSVTHSTMQHAGALAESKNVRREEVDIEIPAEPNDVLENLAPGPETLIDLEEINNNTAESLRLRADGRYPAYMVLSNRAPLEKQYGSAGFTQVDEAIKSVVTATAAHPNWDACLIYADDAASTGAFGLTAVKADDPWAIKHLLADLDEALRKKGEMIAAVLIVGGPQIVPFHHLPNPLDDDDKDVPSDNPYASLDENYFVPTWPVGRLPNGIGEDPAMLIQLLNRIAASRATKRMTAGPIFGFSERLLASFGLGKPTGSSFGYTAEIWRRASHSVYRTIGEPRGLSISPPIGSGRLPKEAGKALQAAYFNLHGLEDTADWYGQRDPHHSPDGPDYPVALSPSDIVNSGRAPQVVYTEACYGAHIFGKSAENALALKFLDSGSKAVVGSTVTSYGSVTTPLIAADLLGQTFWKLLNEGHPAGEALRRAKIAMAHTMHRRQGYLDGEDQKTLISFVLYGDPLAQTSGRGKVPKRILRPEQGSPQVKAICDRAEGHSALMDQLPSETLSTVKAVVKEYLPGMQGSQASFSHEHINCSGHDCRLPHRHAKVAGLAPTRSLVTLSKKVHSAQRLHPQYARITMDAQGKVVKLAVSR